MEMSNMKGKLYFGLSCAEYLKGIRRKKFPYPNRVQEIRYSQPADGIVVVKPDEVKEFREKFVKDLKEDECYVKDLEKIKSNDHYCQRFICHEEDVDKGVKMAQSALKWRKKFEVENITEKMFPQEMWDVSSFYAHGKDKGEHLLCMTTISVLEELEEKLGGRVDSLLNIVKKRKMKWFRHVARSQGLSNTIMFGIVKGSRPKGRPQVLPEFDLPETLSVTYPVVTSNDTNSSRATIDSECTFKVIFHVSKHKKVAEQVELFKKFVIYWFEKLEKESNGQPITMIFDCVGAGLSNMDMDLMRFIVDSFICNYPFFLKYILVIEIPWVLNAAWKIIKLWLPKKSVDLVKFLNKKTVLQFVDASQLLECMGGEVSI
ncbi:Motile sperm domain-containing protein 2 [Nymphon striatum]|nr:Motile sperm domain-containing protein 2 [Nymphon striatum]